MLIQYKMHHKKGFFFSDSFGEKISQIKVNLIFTPLESQNCDDSKYVFCFFFWPKLAKLAFFLKIEIYDRAFWTINRKNREKKDIAHRLRVNNANESSLYAGARQISRVCLFFLIFSFTCKTMVGQKWPDVG